MREYKFRAWDKQINCMIQPEQFADLLNGKEVAWYENRTFKVPSKVTELPFIDLASGASGVMRHVDKWEDANETIRARAYKGNPFALEHIVIMQYTGLKDKEGVEIYEGDIVKDGKVVPIHFEDGHYFAGDSFLSPSLNTMIEVIGNIWENPELLGGTDAPSN